MRKKANLLGLYQPLICVSTKIDIFITQIPYILLICTTQKRTSPNEHCVKNELWTPNINMQCVINLLTSFLPFK